MVGGGGETGEGEGGKVICLFLYSCCFLSFFFSFSLWGLETSVTLVWWLA